VQQGAGLANAKIPWSLTAHVSELLAGKEIARFAVGIEYNHYLTSRNLLANLGDLGCQRDLAIAIISTFPQHKLLDHSLEEFC